ncbi:MAG: LacI family DNA-binding transcriptional regulator [Fimbriimonas sp.]
MATLKDIAKLSGVSTATVSYVLNNGPRQVKADKRERVLAAMQELNYRPHAAARQMKGKSTGTIGVVFPHVVAAPLDNAYFAPILAGILDTVTEQKTSCMLFTGLDWAEAESNVAQYTDGRCDGLILIAARKDSGLMDELRQRGIKFVLIGTHLPGTQSDSVDVDNVLGAELAVSHLLDLGHARITMIQGSANSTSNDERTAGFLAAAAGRAEALLEPGAYQLETALASARRALDRKVRPTALFCGNDLIAQSAYRAAEEMGLDIPEDLSVVGFDDYSFAAGMSPPLTTIRQPLREIGSLAAQVLMTPIREPQGEVRNLRLVPDLVIRGSTAKPPIR